VSVGSVAGCGVQFFVQFNGGLVGFALNRTGLAVATEQQIVFAGQIAGFHHFHQFVVVIQQGHLGA